MAVVLPFEHAEPTIDRLGALVRADLERVNGLGHPPAPLITNAVHGIVVHRAQRHCELVAHLPPQRAALRELKMVRIGRAAAAGEAGLGTDKAEVIPVPQPQRTA